MSAGKGDRPRPLSISRQDWERRFALTFDMTHEWHVAPDGERDPRKEYRVMHDVLWCRLKPRTK